MHKFPNEHTEIMEWVLTLRMTSRVFESNLQCISVEEKYEISKDIEITPDILFKVKNEKSGLIVDAKTCPPDSIISSVGSHRAARIPSFDYDVFSKGIKNTFDKYSDPEVIEFFLKKFNIKKIEIAFVIPQRCLNHYQIPIYNRLIADYPNLFSLWVINPKIELKIELNNHSISLLLKNDQFLLPTKRQVRIYLTRDSPKKLSTFFILKDLIRIAHNEGIRNQYTPEIVQEINEYSNPVYYEHTQDREFILGRWNYALRAACDIRLMTYDKITKVYKFRELTSGSSSSKFSQEFKKLNNL